MTIVLQNGCIQVASNKLNEKPECSHLFTFEQRFFKGCVAPEPPPWLLHCVKFFYSLRMGSKVQMKQLWFISCSFASLALNFLWWSLHFLKLIIKEEMNKCSHNSIIIICFVMLILNRHSRHQVPRKFLCIERSLIQKQPRNSSIITGCYSWMVQ